MAGSGTASRPLPGPPRGVVQADTCLGDFEDGECNECVQEWYSEGFAPEDGCSQAPLQAIFDGLFGPRKLPPTATEDEQTRKPRRRPRLWPF